MSLVTSHPITNSKWVTINSFSSTLSHCISFQGYVSDHAHFSALPSHHMGKSVWVRMSFFMARQSHLSPHGPQEVSNNDTFFVSLLITWDSITITHSKWVTVLFFPVEGSLIIYYPWPIVCQWHFFQAISNFITSHCMTNRKWVTLPLFTCILFHVKWQYVCDSTLSSAHYILLCATACKWHCPIFLCDTLIRSHSMTNSEWVAMPFVSVRKSHHI